MSAPLILACDTTQGACSVAAYRGGVLAEELTPMRKGHAEALIPMMERVMADAKLTMRDIDRLAVTHGPGTFTGTRVGLSAMRGLALALDKPLKAYGSLHVMALAAAHDGPVLVGVDARRDIFYAQGFDASRTPFGAAQALMGDAALALIGEDGFGVLGSGAPLLRDLAAAQGAGVSVLDAPDWPQAAHLAALAAADADWDNPPVPSPLYLRPPDATLPNPAKFPERAK